MKLVFALGNPEEQYKNTRHNVGFQVLTNYAKEKGIEFMLKAKFKAYLAEFSYNGDKILIALPTTYYNLAGESYRAICDFYKIAVEDTLIVHDELALPFGTIRTRAGGSDAGNNGIKSIMQHGGIASCRARIGINNELHEQMAADAAFVLAQFSKAESHALLAAIPQFHATIDDFVAGRHMPTTYTFDI